MSPLTICIIIFALSLISYALNKIPMGLTALLTLAALIFTGCLEPDVALSGFASTNTIIIVGMFVISAALNRTSYIDRLSNGIVKLSGGSFKRAYFGFIILSALLTNFLTSPMVAYGIVFPLAATMCKKFDVCASKVQYALCVVCIGCCSILPFGYAINATAQYNGYMEAYGFVGTAVKATDFLIGRWPLMIIVILWAYFLAPMATPAIPIAMAAGGYDIKSLFKQGWLISILMMAGYVFYTMTVLPAF